MKSSLRQRRATSEGRHFPGRMTPLDAFCCGALSRCGKPNYENASTITLRNGQFNQPKLLKSLGRRHEEERAAPWSGPRWLTEAQPGQYLPGPPALNR